MYRKVKKQNTRNIKYYVGVDEVGRGPIAGPLLLCAVIVPISSYSDFVAFSKKNNLKDSKSLSEKRRREILELFKEKKDEFFFSYFFAWKKAHSIDRYGIRVSLFQAVHSLLSQIKRNINQDLSLFYFYFDASIPIPEEIYGKSFIRGDEQFPLISLASVFAKERRDYFMKRISKLYPQYSFEKNKGYGTKEHYQAIRAHGLCSIHRHTWIHLD